MSKIINIVAREILDSRGYPTVEVDVYTKQGNMGRASSPSGASVGSNEACELRDNEKNRFLGKGVLRAVDNVNSVIKNALVGTDVLLHNDIDNILIALDNTSSKTNIGANAIIATSMAIIKAAAKDAGNSLFRYLNKDAVTLPMPMMNIINGGAHANNDLDIQEFMVIPVGAASMRDALRMAAEIFHHLKIILINNNVSTSVGDEGGFAPSLKYNRAALDLILSAIEKAGYRPGHEVLLALDVASSEFFSEGKYHLRGEKLILNHHDLIKYYENLINEYPIYSIEDGMAETDFIGWAELTSSIGDKIQLVGDDVFVTNKEILADCIDKNIANTILIKPNQVGTITEAYHTVKYAHDRGYKTVMSHRSGETEDVTIAHLAVAWQCSQIKTGSLCRVDRTAKYNELLRIEEIVGKDAKISSIKEKKKILAL